MLRSRAKAGVIAGFVLGLFGIVACFFTVWAVIAAVVGLGLWGLSSAHRGTAVATILLCCLTLLIGSFFGLASWYESRYGYKPWDAPAGWGSATPKLGFGGLGLLGFLSTEVRWINLTREHMVFRTLEKSWTGKWGTGK